MKLPHLNLGKRKPSRQGSAGSGVGTPRDDVGPQVTGTPRDGTPQGGRSGSSPALASGPGSTSSESPGSLSSGDEAPRRRRIVTRIFRPLKGKRQKAQVKRTSSSEAASSGGAKAPGLSRQASVDAKLSAAAGKGGATTAKVTTRSGPVCEEPGSAAVSVVDDLPRNVTVRSQPEGVGLGDRRPSGGSADGSGAVELVREDSKQSKASSSRDSIFSMFVTNISGFFGARSNDGSSEALPRLGSDDSAIDAARNELLTKNQMSTSDGILLEDDEDAHGRDALAAAMQGGAAADGEASGSAAMPPPALGTEDLTGSDADLCNMVDMQQLEELWGLDELPNGATGDDLAGDGLNYGLNYASAPPSRAFSGEAVSELAGMLAHGGSSMDMLRVELDMPSPSDLEKGPRQKKGGARVPAGGPPPAPVPAAGLAGLGASFSLLPPSWGRSAESSSSGGQTSPSSTSQTSSSTGGVKAGGAGNGARKNGAGGGGDGGKPGARNTLGRKEWTAEEDAIIMAEVEVNGQKWRVIAAKLPGRSDDAVRNRWKRLSAEAASQASAVADALGIASGGGSSNSDDPPGSVGEGEGEAKPAKAAKPKAERLAWSKAEDAEIVRCVQAHGLKWGRISQNLPGRTAHAIRNRFHRLQQLQQEQAAASGNVLPQPQPIAVA